MENKLKVLSLFSGIGAFEKALTNIGVSYDLVNYCEIDKYASKSYSVIHNVSEDFNLWDITKIDVNKLNNFDLLTHGSPCQSFSIAGKQEGGDIGSETRSSLMWDTVEIIKHKKPKYVIWENVKNVLSKKHKHNFDKYIEELRKLGYTSYYEILNSKHFDTPQNRERIYVVSILDKQKDYIFPKGKELGITLNEILEYEVDDKYYINKPFNITNKNNSKTGILCVGNTNPSGRGMNGNVYDSKGISPTLTTNKGEGYKVVVDRPIELGFIPYPNSNKKHQSNTFYSVEGISVTLDTCSGGNRQVKILEKENEYFLHRIRKLTPREYWRLQKFSDEDFNKCFKAKISNTQLYKQAGNSITVSVLEEIFKNLLLY